MACVPQKVSALTLVTDLLGSAVLYAVDDRVVDPLDRSRGILLSDFLRTAPDGSLADPAFSFLNDQASGLYLHAVGDLRLVSSGALTMAAGGLNKDVVISPSGIGDTYVRSADHSYLFLQSTTDTKSSGVRFYNSAGTPSDWEISMEGSAGTPAYARKLIIFDTKYGQYRAIFGIRDSASWGTTGVHLDLPAGTFTDASGAGTVASAVSISIGASTYISSAARIITDAASLYIAGDVIAGAGVTLTNTYGLWNVGKTRLDGRIDAGGVNSSYHLYVYSGGNPTAPTYTRGLVVQNSGTLIGISATNYMAESGYVAIGSGGFAHTGGIYGISYLAQYDGVGGTNDYLIGGQFGVNGSGTTVTTEMRGVSSYVAVSGSGNQPLGYAFFATTTKNSTGVLSSYHAYYAETPATGFGATIGACFSCPWTAATNRFGLYLTGSVQNHMAGNLGIGVTPASDKRLYLSGSSSGATTMYGLYNAAAIQSSVTGTFIGYTTDYSTQAAAFTLTNLIHYSTNRGTIGAASSITNQTGYEATASLAGATNNYGFRGRIASATSTYNLYMDGTANNYIAGNTGIGATPNAYDKFRVQNAYTTLPDNSTDGNFVVFLSTGAGAGAGTTQFRAFLNYATANGTNNVAELMGAYDNVINGVTDGAKTVASLTGHRITARSTSAGLTTTGYGLSVDLQITGAGNWTSFNSVYVAAPVLSSTGVIGTIYGFRVAAQKITGVTTAYGVYQEGTSDLNYFFGVTGIGVAPSTTTNLILAASTTGISSLRLPHGAAPSSPVNGDIWTTTAGLFVRVNGATVGPLS